MRGKAPAKPKKSISIRITPAYAGKSKAMEQKVDQIQDHPRLCGEKSSYNRMCVIVIGSPPPMRGKD